MAQCGCACVFLGLILISIYRCYSLFGGIATASQLSYWVLGCGFILIYGWRCNVTTSVFVVILLWFQSIRPQRLRDESALLIYHRPAWFEIYHVVWFIWSKQQNQLLQGFSYTTEIRTKKKRKNRTLTEKVNLTIALRAAQSDSLWHRRSIQIRIETTWRSTSFIPVYNQ